MVAMICDQHLPAWFQALNGALPRRGFSCVRLENPKYPVIQTGICLNLAMDVHLTIYDSAAKQITRKPRTNHIRSLESVHFQRGFS